MIIGAVLLPLLVGRVGEGLLTKDEETLVHITTGLDSAAAVASGFGSRHGPDGV